LVDDTPDYTEWLAGKRTVRCIVVSTGHPMTGFVQHGAGRTAPSPA
jgi:hypothetical protein